MRSKTLLMGSGIALVAASILAHQMRDSWASASPGRLQATRESLHWRSPDPSVGTRPGPSSPMFEVVNVGVTPVQILSVKTNCGCAASIQAEPRMVPPGGKSAVIVSLDPLEVGARPVTILLETDAPATPEVKLELVQEGYRRPPYVFQFVGQLFYQQGYSRDATREVAVDVVMPRESPAGPPMITTDLSFMEFGPPTVSEIPYITDPRMVMRSYRFPVRFVADPPAEVFSGQVSVADPWIPGRILSLNVFGKANPPIHAIPARLVLDADGARSSARFLARSTRDRLPLKAMAEGDDSPLVVAVTGAADENGYYPFEVRWQPGREVTEGDHNVIVRTEPAGTASLTIPVLVRDREG